MREEIKEHIRLLAIGHFVFAGLTALFSLFPVIHIIFGAGILSGAFPTGTPEEEFPTKLVGSIFLGVGTAVVVTGMVFAGLIAYAGKNLKKMQRRTYCLVIAGAICAIFPFGTVLGVLSLLVLLKPEAKSLFLS